MSAVPTFQRVVRRNGVLDLEYPAQLAPRQLASVISSLVGPGGASTTTAAPTTTTTTQAPTTTTSTTSNAPSTTTAAPSTTTTRNVPSTTTTTQAPTSDPSTTSTTTRGRTSSSVSADTTVTSVITPTTIIVVGTSTITSALAPITSMSTRPLSSSDPTPTGASAGSGLSTGAKIGIGVGVGVGGLLALGLLAFLCLGAGRKRREKRDAADNILWPATGDSAALYPEPVHQTGHAGFGVGDDGDELDGAAGGGGGHGMAEVAGAGAAGLGAAGALGRFGSQSTGGHQSAYPAMPPSVYTTDHSTHNGGYYDGSSPEAASAYTNYSAGPTPSQQSHAPLALGPASIGYVASQERHSPSPPRTGTTSNDGHASYEGAVGSQSGHLPFPGEAEQDVPERTLSPRPMQVGDTFGRGYDETDGGRRWRLSVVNDDPRDRE